MHAVSNGDLIAPSGVAMDGALARSDDGSSAAELRAAKRALARYTPPVEATPDNIRRWLLLKRTTSGTRIARDALLQVAIVAEKNGAHRE